MFFEKKKNNLFSANLQKSFRSSGASKILSGVEDMYLVLTEAGVIAWL